MRRVKPPKPLPLVASASLQKTSKSKGFVCPSSALFVSWLVFVISCVLLLGVTKYMLRTDPPATILLSKTVVTILFLLGKMLLLGIGSSADVGSLVREDVFWWQGVGALHTLSKLTSLVGFAVCSLPLFCASACLSALGHGFTSSKQHNDDSSSGNVVLGAVVVVGVLVVGFQNASKVSGHVFVGLGVSALSFWIYLYVWKRSSVDEQAKHSQNSDFFLSLFGMPILVCVYSWSVDTKSLGLFSFFCLVPLFEMSGSSKLLLGVVLLLEEVKSRAGNQLLSKSSARVFVGSELVSNMIALLLGVAGVSPFAQKTDSSVWGVVVVVLMTCSAVALVPRNNVIAKRLHMQQQQSQQQQQQQQQQHEEDNLQRYHEHSDRYKTE
jgi:hypothetical protein